jgi:YesN/AraC family two-component response regulator
MSPEESYSLSDYYIQKADKCRDEASLREVHSKMIIGYTDKMRQLKSGGVCSKQIVHTIDYITSHLHGRITLESTAEALNISPAYLSRLFKSETGFSFSDYVNKLKIEEASALLLYTRYTDLEISNLLCFSSQSYFIKVFKKFTGVTPKEYKKQYDLKNIMPELGGKPQ